MSEQDPWDRWNLQPYVPDTDNLPPVSLCVDPTAPERAKPKVAAYGELKGFAYCDRRMTYTDRSSRGKFGRRSPRVHSANCPKRAVIQVLYDNGSVAVRCKDHTP